MNYKVVTTEESESTFNQNVDYLLEEWSDKVTDQFVNRVDDVIQKIKQNPFLYPLHNYQDNVRKATVNKRVILYYRIVDGSVIELLTFWNSYRNPDDLKF